MKIKIKFDVMDLNGEGAHILIPASFDQENSINLIIDTGASKSVFDISIPKKYIKKVSMKEYLLGQGFDPITVEVATGGEDNKTLETRGISSEKIETSFGIIKKLYFKDIEILGYAAPLIDLKPINDIYKSITNLKITGLLGSDFLLEYKAVIDYGKKTLTLNFVDK